MRMRDVPKTVKAVPHDLSRVMQASKFNQFSPIDDNAAQTKAQQLNQDKLLSLDSIDAETPNKPRFSRKWLQQQKK